MSDKLERYVIGPALTAAILFLHYQLIQTGVLPVTAAGLNLLVLIASFVGGIRSGLASASLLAIYNVTFLGPISTERAVVIGSYFIIALLVGLRTRQERARRTAAIAAWNEAETNRRKAEVVDSINGNIHLATEAMDLLDILREGWRALPEDKRLHLVERARGKLADWVTLVQSFKIIARERKLVLEDDAKS